MSRTKAPLQPGERVTVSLKRDEASLWYIVTVHDTEEWTAARLLHLEELWRELHVLHIKHHGESSANTRPQGRY
ncbi:hypothetical protein [Deinococcus peraridilitoris]|uniref:Uncharacterized protein n=1 Tax=Deinococcus peraridilitoris (strain DSM 19664 / LMG 22246 / CIP 109416 / KR-200) TaxID=937777 RepID=L0A699_DEIPD|nr:hypothetical protein [Deinococcus peraridilitoris]AFZ69413.1 hypothetical protein Deipe_4022 [Deinococcus peraridilitoris DSM 19664]